MILDCIILHYIILFYITLHYILFYSISIFYAIHCVLYAVFHCIIFSTLLFLRGAACPLRFVRRSPWTSCAYVRRRALGEPRRSRTEEPSLYSIVELLEWSIVWYAV